MKENKKGFTLIELLAVIVILALIMGIAITAMGDVLNKSEKNAARRTAASLIDGVRQRLTLAGRLKKGCYAFENSILEKGGINSPLGGEWKYATDAPSGFTAVNGATGIYKASDSSSCSCSAAGTYSYVLIGGSGSRSDNDYTSDEQFTYSICLVAGSENPYIDGSESDITKDSPDVIKGE